MALFVTTSSIHVFLALHLNLHLFVVKLALHLNLHLFVVKLPAPKTLCDAAKRQNLVSYTVFNLQYKLLLENCVKNIRSSCTSHLIARALSTGRWSRFRSAIDEALSPGEMTFMVSWSFDIHLWSRKPASAERLVSWGTSSLLSFVLQSDFRQSLT